MISVAFKTLGCPKNEADSERMKAVVDAAGYTLSEDIDTASVLVINTCSFIEEATTESISLILEAAGIWLPKQEDRHILVTGCMVSRYGSTELKGEIPEVSDFIPVVDEDSIVEVIERLTGVAAESSEFKRRAESSFAYVKISDGCHRTCSYCTIPSIRGDYVSRSLEEIRQEIINLIETGAREIVLIGQDITSYGRDFDNDYAGPRTLTELLKSLLDLEVLRYRLMYLQPESITDELLKLIASSDKIAHYLEIPLQHADRDILRSMQRAGDGKRYLELLAKIRTLIPDVALRTTVIVGYPGETEEQFEALQSFIEKAEFDYAGVFTYSQEQGTLAAELANQIDDETKIERFQILRDLSDNLSWAQASRYIGTMQEVLIEGRDEEGVPYGRTYFQAPDIDGIVRVSCEPASAEIELAVGDVVSVRIEDSILYDLDGTLVP